MQGSPDVSVEKPSEGTAESRSEPLVSDSAIHSYLQSGTEPHHGAAADDEDDENDDDDDDDSFSYTHLTLPTILLV